MRRPKSGRVWCEFVPLLPLLFSPLLSLPFRYTLVSTYVVKFTPLDLDKMRFYSLKVDLWQVYGFFFSLYRIVKCKNQTSL